LEALKKEKTTAEELKPEKAIAPKKIEFTPPQSSDGFWD
jgi:hypothetical protein